MSRFAILLYGVLGYAIFFAVFLYLIGFVSGFFVPTTVDDGAAESPLGTAVLINLALIALFGIQHTIMARPWFKQAIASVVPPSIERTTFMLVTSVIFVLMFMQWRAIPGELWSVEGDAAWVLHGVAFVGWGIALISTFLIDHFDLFGLRQTWLAFRGVPYTRKPFVERSLYRWVRHPLMLGFLIAFWSTPEMTAGHALFAGGFTVYVLIGLAVEERDLVAMHGEAYRDYQRRVPKLIPLGARRPGAGSRESSTQTA